MAVFPRLCFSVLLSVLLAVIASSSSVWGYSSVELYAQSASGSQHHGIDASSQNDSESGPTGNDAAAGGDQAPPYIDRLIDEAEGGRPAEDWAVEKRGSLWPGFSALSLTGRFYREYTNLGEDYKEYGLQLVNRTETLNNGSFEISADGLVMDDDGRNFHADGGRFRLRHSGLVLTDTWQMDSTLGYFRSQTPRLISTSYRIHLPSTLLEGADASFSNQWTTISFTAGQIGRLEGIAAQRFKTTQGSLQGLSLVHGITENWQVATQVWNTENAQYADAHQNYAGVVQYAGSDNRRRYQLHLLADSRGRSGYWFNGVWSLSRWAHYAGAYYLQPDLRWTDATINTDRLGAYWRVDHRSFRRQWTGGTEIWRNNIEQDPETAGYVTTQSFINGSWRLRRDTLAGAAAAVTTRHADSGTAEDNAVDYNLTHYLSRRFSFGTTRLQVEMDVRDASKDDVDAYTFEWDQIWRAPFVRHLNTNAAYVLREDRGDEITLRFAAEKTLGVDFWIRAAAQYVYLLEEDPYRDDAASASLSMSWQFHPNWRIDLSADYNKSLNREATDAVDNDEIEPEGHTLLLSLSYSLFGAGRPRQYVGRETGSLGSGEIRGRVFLDENRNGRYDLDETPLRSIVVILDGRYQTETDANGQYRFRPVAGGSHIVSIGIEDVPLPWGLYDDKPQPVYVPVRGIGALDFSLVKLNE